MRSLDRLKGEQEQLDGDLSPTGSILFVNHPSARKNLSPDLTRWQVNLLIEEAKTYMAEEDVTSCCTSLIDALPLVQAIHLQNREEPMRRLLQRCKNLEPHNEAVMRLEKAFTSNVLLLSQVERWHRN